MTRPPHVLMPEKSPSYAVKSKLGYPVIDTDVHTNDYAPLLEQYVERYGGVQLVDRLRNATRRQTAGGKNWYEQTTDERHYHRNMRQAWWGRVTRNTLDLATYGIPELFQARQAEQGSDYSILFPNGVLAAGSVRGDDRRALARAINHYHADTFAKYKHSLTPVAGIPLETPQEGIEELEFAVKVLGLKVANISGAVRRPIPALADKYPRDAHPELGKHISYLDFYGLDSAHDYDPFWAKAVELGVPITLHFGSQGWTGRSSISNYMYNHIGHFADASEAFAKALFFGGVTRRFPKLRVGLLEGGAAWGANVFIHLIDRFEKRNVEALQNYNPALIDAEQLVALYAQYGQALHGGKLLEPQALIDAVLGTSGANVQRIVPPQELNEFAAAGIETPQDIKTRWVDSFYFGSEADDRTVAAAFNDRANPLRTKVNAIYSSDVGHWDVPDLTHPLAESWALVQDGVLTEADFKAFVFDNPYRFYTQANPAFFAGTAVEEKLRLPLAA